MVLTLFKYRYNYFAMRPKYLLALFLLLVNLPVNGQSPAWTWVRHIVVSWLPTGGLVVGDKTGCNISVGDYSGTAIVGGTTFNAVERDIILSKCDATDHVIWAKSFAKLGVDIKTISLAVDRENNIYLCGFLRDTAVFGPLTLISDISPAIRQYYIVKFDPDGSPIWAVKTDSSSVEITSLTVDNSLNVYIAGHKAGTNRDYYFSKYSSGGSRLWIKTTNYPGDQKILSITADDYGNIYFCGTLTGQYFYYGAVAVSNYQYNTIDMIVGKTDTSGNLKWLKIFGGKKDDIAYSIRTVGTSLYVAASFEDTINLAGVNHPSRGNSDALLVKFDTLGSVNWTRTAGSINDDEALLLCLDNNNNPYISGYYLGGMRVGGDSLTCVPNKKNIFLTKYNDNGDAVWTKGIGNYNGAKPLSISFDNYQNLYMTGNFSNIVYLDSLELWTTHPTTITPIDDAFIAKLGISSAGVNDATSDVGNFFTIFPNPGNNTLNIMQSNNQFTELYIHDSFGRIVYKQIIRNRNSITLDISFYPNGLYYMSLANSTVTQTHNFVVYH